MKRAPNYWGVLSAVVLGLVAVTWGMEEVVDAHAWPFHWVWGGTFVLTGIIIFVMGQLSPERVRSLPFGDPNAPLPPPPPREARVALRSLAACLVLGGLVYGLTSRLAAFALALVVVVLAGRLVAIRGPAA